MTLRERLMALLPDQVGALAGDLKGFLVPLGLTLLLALWTGLAPWLPSFRGEDRELDLALKPLGTLGFDETSVQALREKGEAWRAALGFDQPASEDDPAPAEEEAQSEAERLAAEALAGRPQGGLGPLSAILRATFIATEAADRRFAVVEILEEGAPKFVELEEGDALSGWNVMQIRRREVRFQRDAVEETLHLFPRPEPTPELPLEAPSATSEAFTAS